ncbi:MAG TPA: glycosyltransferase [Gemmatimonadota bacterium]
MKVTVLLTTFEHEAFVAQAIESVLAQETNFPFELVVLEDCSRDRTREIVGAYQNRHPARMRVVLADRNRNDNANFMQAYRESAATYVAMLDGDDFWTSPHKLQRQVDHLEAHPECAICFHNVVVVNADGASIGETTNAPDERPLWGLEDLLRRNPIAGCSAVLRRGAGGGLPAWLRAVRFTDWALYVLHARGGTAAYLDEVLGAYRVHAGGMWSWLDKEAQAEQVVTFLERLNADLGFAYDSVLRPEIARRALRLADLYARRGDRRRARAHLARHLAGLRRGAADPDPYVAKLALRVYLPPVYRVLRAARVIR